jgi:hypothetical protein
MVVRDLTRADQHDKNWAMTRPPEMMAVLSSRLQAMVDAGVINLEPTLPGR